MSGNFNWDQVIQQPGEGDAANPQGNALNDILNQIPDRNGAIPAQDPFLTPATQPATPPVADPLAAEAAFDQAPIAPPAAANPVYQEQFYEPAPTGYAEATIPPVEQVAAPVIETYAEPAPVYAEPTPAYTEPVYTEPAPAAPPVAMSPYEPEPSAPPIYEQVVTPPPPQLQPEPPKMQVVSGDVMVNDPYRNFPSVQELHIDDILRLAVESRASDIHLTNGLPPMTRIDGDIVAMQYQSLKPMDIRRLVFDILNDDQVTKFETTHELDFSYGAKGLGRFRFNVYMQRGITAAAIRAIPSKIPTFQDLNLPEILREICNRSSGLILVTGPTGSGKSTTIAAMLDDINEREPGHIITIEDPIEYVHNHKRCMVNQREMHADTYSFHNALRAVLREDPDIILVGELRDLETIEAALTMAETGHLVFGTLHTRNAPSTIDRVIDVFPSDQQDQIRVLLGNTLEGVISQQLLQRVGGGRVAAMEIMLGTPAIKNLIREGKTHQMYSIIETNKSLGMVTMDASLSYLVQTGAAHYEEALMCAVDKESFAKLCKRVA